MRSTVLSSHINNLQLLCLRSFPFTAKTVLSAVQKALDVGLVLHNHENRDQKAGNHESEVNVIGREGQLEVAHHRKGPERDSCTDAPHRNVLRREREDNPHAQAYP